MIEQASSSARRRWTAELVLHLVRRELRSSHRVTLLGLSWPLLRQLVQLAVLVFVFSRVIDLGIEDYPTFVFSGLVVWAWFLAGVSAATGSLFSGRHLVFLPRFPTVVLPVVAVGVAFVDLLLALPVLGVLLGVSGRLDATAVLLPLALVVQGLLMCGLGWLAAAVAVYLRDVQQAVTVGLLLLFYLTPVFYDLSSVPEDARLVLRLNPMATFVELDRALLLGSDLPPAGALAYAAAVSVALFAGGLVAFRRLRHGFVDEL